MIKITVSGGGNRHERYSMNKHELENKIESFEKELANLKAEIARFDEREDFKPGDDPGDDFTALFRFTLKNGLRFPDTPYWREQIRLAEEGNAMLLELADYKGLWPNNGERKYWIEYYSDGGNFGGECAIIIQGARFAWETSEARDNAIEKVGHERLLAMLRCGVGI